MKLSQEVIIGLKRLGNQALISDDCFKSLMQAASFELSKNSGSVPKPNFNELCISKPDIVKESFASLLILLVECSRHSLDKDTLITTLENYNLNLPRLKEIADLYVRQKPEFQLSLQEIGTSHPKIKKVNWRLDFCIKSSSLERESRAIYFIQIETSSVRRKSLFEDVMEQKKYSFTCTLQQLQELVAKLRDASRLIHSIANSK